MGRYDGEDELLAALGAFDGQLAAAIFAQADEEQPLTVVPNGSLAELICSIVPTARPRGALDHEGRRGGQRRRRRPVVGLRCVDVRAGGQQLLEPGLVLTAHAGGQLHVAR